MRIYNIDENKLKVNKFARNMVYRIIKGAANIGEKTIKDQVVRLRSNVYSSSSLSWLIKNEVAYPTNGEVNSRPRILEIPLKLFISIRDEFEGKLEKEEVKKEKVEVKKEEKKEVKPSFDFDTLLTYMQDYDLRFIIKPSKYTDNFMLVVQTIKNDFSKKLGYELMKIFKIRVGDNRPDYVSFLILDVYNPNEDIGKIMGILREIG